MFIRLALSELITYELEYVCGRYKQSTFLCRSILNYDLIASCVLHLTSSKTNIGFGCVYYVSTISTLLLYIEKPNLLLSVKTFRNFSYLGWNRELEYRYTFLNRRPCRFISNDITIFVFPQKDGHIIGPLTLCMEVKIHVMSFIHVWVSTPSPTFSSKLSIVKFSVSFMKYNVC